MATNRKQNEKDIADIEQKARDAAENAGDMEVRAILLQKNT